MYHLYLYQYMKALVWFWIIDETYALTFVMSCEMSQVGAIPSEEHGGTQEMVMITWNDEMATCDDDQVLNMEKKKEKNKTLWRSM